MVSNGRDEQPSSSSLLQTQPLVWQVQWRPVHHSLDPQHVVLHGEDLVHCGDAQHYQLGCF